MKALHSILAARSHRRATSLAAAAFGLLVLGAIAPGAVAGTLQNRDDASRNSVPAPSNVRITADQPTRKLTLAKGRSIIVDLPEDCAEVFVGAPTVANAVVRSPRRLYVLAINTGPTTIFALDKEGRQVATLEINVSGRDASELEAILNTAMPNNDIHVRMVKDTVILTGSVDSAVDAQRAYDVAQAFVGYSTEGSTGGGTGTNISLGETAIVSGRLINSLTIRGKDQVTLKVMLVEIRRDVIKQLGITSSGSWGSIGAGGISGSGTVTNPISTATGAFSGMLSAVGSKSSLQASIQAYESNGVARVLAEPTVTAISGESAKFTAGGTIPIAAQGSIDATTGVCTITYTQQPYGVTLNFTPTVLSEGRISLHLSTQVVEQDNTNTQVTTTCGGGQTGFRTRQNETTVELPSGGSIVSAGLIQQASQQTIAGTPGLMNLPILGALFRSRNYQRSETELMIIVTPYLAKTLRPEQVSKPDDGFTDATDPQSWLLGRMNRIYSTSNNPALIQQYRGRVGFIND